MRLLSFTDKNGRDTDIEKDLLPGVLFGSKSFFVLFKYYSLSFICMTDQGRIAKQRAGKPDPAISLGKDATIKAPVAGTLSRFARNSIW